MLLRAVGMGIPESHSCAVAGDVRRGSQTPRWSMELSVSGFQIQRSDQGLKTGSETTCTPRGKLGQQPPAAAT